MYLKSIYWIWEILEIYEIHEIYKFNSYPRFPWFLNILQFLNKDLNLTTLFNRYVLHTHWSLMQNTHSQKGLLTIVRKKLSLLWENADGKWCQEMTKNCSVFQGCILYQDTISLTIAMGENFQFCSKTPNIWSFKKFKQ